MQACNKVLANSHKHCKGQRAHFGLVDVRDTDSIVAAYRDHCKWLCCRDDCHRLPCVYLLPLECLCSTASIICVQRSIVMARNHKIAVSRERYTQRLASAEDGTLADAIREGPELDEAILSARDHDGR